MTDPSPVPHNDVTAGESAAPIGESTATGARPSPRHIVDPFERKVELVAAILLSVATIVTAWSAFQATKWSGVMAIEFSNANAARTESAERFNEGGQLGEIDVTLFTQWMNAHVTGDEELATDYSERFRDDFTPAFDEWIALDPFDDLDAPSTPFALDTYALPQFAQADEFSDRADAASADARDANQRGDNYVLTTVLFASVLFFAGVSNKFESRRAKVITVGMGVVILLVGVVLIATFPIEI